MKDDKTMIRDAQKAPHNNGYQEDLADQVSITTRPEMHNPLHPEDQLNVPYKGLNPFTEADASLFFGRENDIQEVVNNLLTWRLTLLYGKSGVGKSSILRAGVTHILNEEARHNLIDYDGVPKMAVVVFPSLEGELSWKEDPLTSLLQQIEKTITQTGWDIKVPEPGLSFIDTINAWAEALGGEEGDGELYVILDQFEEYFLYHAHNTKGDRFYTEFPRAVNCPNLPVNFLISTREDSLAALDCFKSLIPGLFEHRLQIGHLDGESAEAAIKQPIEYYNQLHNTDIKIEQALVNTILEEVQVGKVVIGESGRGGVTAEPTKRPKMQIETPYLQLVMERLWKEELDQGSNCIKLATYRALGQAEQIVKDHLNHQMNLLTNEERQISASIFQYLVTLLGTKCACSVDELAPHATCGKSSLKKLLEKLSSGQQRILRPEGKPEPNKPYTQRYEIFHDALAKPILEWRSRYERERTLEEEKVKFEEKQRQETERLQFEAKQQRITAEKQQIESRKRLNRRWSLFLGGLSVATVSLLLFGFYQYRRNEIQDLNLDARKVRIDLGSANQLDSLKNALEIGNNVQQQSLEHRVPASTLALQQILSRIQLQNRWDLRDLEELEVLGVSGENFIASPYSFAQSLDGQWIAIGSIDGRIALWSFENSGWQIVFPADNKGGNIVKVALDATGERIATVSESRNIEIWNRKGESIQSFSATSQAVEQKSSFSLTSEHDPQIGLSPDGKTLAVVSETRTIDLWDVATGNRIKSSAEISEYPIGPNQRIFKIKFSRDGRLLGIAAQGEILVWDLVNDLVNPWEVAAEQKIFDLSFSPDNNYLATVSSNKTGRLWDLQSGSLLDVFGGHEGAIFSVAFHPEGNKLVTGATDGTARVWDIKFGRVTESGTNAIDYTEQLSVLSGHDSFIPVVGFTEHDDKIVTVTQLGTVSLWTVEETPLLSENFSASTKDFRSRAFSHVSISPDGQWMAAASLDGQPWLWNLSNLQEDGHKFLIEEEETQSTSSWMARVYFSSDSQKLGTISGNGKAQLWNLDGTLNRVLFEPEESAYGGAIGLDLDRGQVVTYADDGTVRVLNFQGPEQLLLHQFELTQDIRASRVSNVRLGYADFSPQNAEGVSQYLALVLPDGTAYLWNLEDGRTKKLKGSDSSRFISIRFSPDGKRIATASREGTAQVWDLQAKEIKQFLQDTPIMSVDFSGDGKWLATTSWNGIALIWDVMSEGTDPVASYRATSGLWDAVFGPGDKQLATVGWGNVGTLWPVRTLEDLMYKDGCGWIEEHYLESHPDERKDFDFCN
jgi:WD40 repeat protein